ncbi:MAG: hypothetical protein JWM34_1470 [Ilumatobacteraceae bacterium]|nr:hypothetical protein [Ilumatobacteraceae bacterium]
MTQPMRLVHVGVAAAMAAATVTAIGLVPSAGATGSTASVYVPIVPCRLVDTRSAPDNVGPRETPLGAGEAVTFAVWGTNGNCTIPNTATGVATNVTAVDPTASSYVTVYPADAGQRPTASNLNVVAGGAPTPNQVTVGLSAAGAIAAYNNGGTVDLVIDIVGYYQAAPAVGGGVVNNDDRYYTKTQIDTTVGAVNGSIAQTNAVVATKLTKPTGTRDLNISGSQFAPEASTSAYTTGVSLLSPGTNGSCYTAAVTLPDGAAITELTATVGDFSSTQKATVTLWAAFAGGAFGEATLQTTAPDAPGIIALNKEPSPALVVDNQTFAYVLEFCGGINADVREITFTYTLP